MSRNKNSLSPTETTRLEPFAIPIWKTCTETIELEDYDGRTITVEKGMIVTLPMDALHRHPDYYQNAEEFEPERFDRSSDNAKKLKEAGVFMPFGNGARSCLGNFKAFQSNLNYFKLITYFDCRKAICSYFYESYHLYTCQ